MVHETVIVSRDLFSMTGSYPCLHGKVMEKRSGSVKSMSCRIHFAKVYRSGAKLHDR